MSKDLLPEYVAHQLKDVISVVCRNLVLVKKHSGATSEKQEDTMCKVHHGRGGCGSALSELVQGKGNCAHLFNHHEIENNREGNECRKKAGKMLELKEVFHMKAGYKCILHEGGFTTKKLQEGLSDKLITGRNIQYRVPRTAHLCWDQLHQQAKAENKEGGGGSCILALRCDRMCVHLAI